MFDNWVKTKEETKGKFIATAKYYEEVKVKLEETRVELTALMAELGYNTMIQDAETGAVYKIVKPNGTFTYYRDIEYVRTALEGERAGTLSKKEAEGAGFTLKKS